MSTQQEREKRAEERLQMTEAQIQKSEAREEHLQHIFRHILHNLERIIAVITLVVLLASLGKLLIGLALHPRASADVMAFLHEVLTIVIGLEFIRMLIDTTPASILEVLTVAITRHVILSHDDPVSNLLSVACIAGLFAIRRYLFRRGELKEEMVEKE